MKTNLPEQQAVETMDSLHGLQRAEANPYLYTRIRQRMMNKGQTTAPENLMFRLAFILLIFILANVFTYDRLETKPASATGNTNIEAFASDYELNGEEENI